MILVDTKLKQNKYSDMVPQLKKIQLSHLTSYSAIAKKKKKKKKKKKIYIYIYI